MRGALRRLLFLAFSVLCGFTTARAADQTVQGRALIVKNPGTAAQRAITVKAREPASDDSVVGDPVADGATLTIAVNGGTPSAETYALPAAFWSGNAAHGFTYRDREGANGPVKRVQLKLRHGVFHLQAKVDGKLGPIGVLPPDPGSDGCALLGLTGGDSYSVRFVGGDVKNDGAALFKLTRPDGAGSCVTTTTATSTTTSTIPLPLLSPPGAAPRRYRDQIFGAVTTTSDIVYGSAVDNSGATITLRLDVYAPAGDAVTARPLIVWVHGGSFAFGDKTSGELVDEATVFGKKGYVNASINYRLEPGGCTGSGPVAVCVTAMLEAWEDAQAAIRFLRDNAATYGIDTTRVAIGGSSAGAITALHVGFSSDDPTAAVRAAVSLSGGNLLAAISPDDAPSLLFHGTADTIVPYQWAVSTVDRALAAGLDAFLTTWVGAGHVPYVAHRTEILDQTTNFLYWEMNLANAAQ